MGNDAVPLDDEQTAVGHCAGAARHPRKAEANVAELDDESFRRAKERRLGRVRPVLLGAHPRVQLRRQVVERAPERGNRARLSEEWEGPFAPTHSGRRRGRRWRRALKSSNVLPAPGDHVARESRDLLDAGVRQRNVRRLGKPVRDRLVIERDDERRAPVSGPLAERESVGVGDSIASPETLMQHDGDARRIEQGVATAVADHNVAASLRSTAPLRRRRQHLIVRVDRTDLSKNTLRGFKADILDWARLDS